jgi:diadenosine tetraphosphate (Ap4A) HIT family hydrolase
MTQGHSSANTWRKLAAGVDCPFDAPRASSTDHWEHVATLVCSSLYLPTNQTYRGHCILVLDLRHATRPDQLTRQEWKAFCDDLYVAQHAIERVVRPDHMNVATLGNVMPHLHWHIVPRYEHDPRWGAPIWSSDLANDPSTRLTDADFAALLEDLRGAVER